MRAIIYAILLAALAQFTSLAAFADEAYAPDDTVYLDIATEGYVTTKTAKVTATVDAAATDTQSGDLRDSMQKAIAGVAKDGEWRLTSVNRVADDSGLTRWQAMYEARLAEGALSGLGERAQKLSKPGMQIRIANIDFTPTLAETESRRAELRADLYKRANEELARLNATLPGRGYRIASISFDSGGAMPQPVPAAAPMMAMKAARMAPMESASGAAEVSAHIDLTARIAYAARPDTGAAKANGAR